MSSQVVVVPEMVRHDAPNAIVSVPVVVVLSVYVPSDLIVHIPDTCNDPVTGAELHPTPSDDRSNCPLTLRHEPPTVHVPAALPPHADTFVHDAETEAVELVVLVPDAVPVLVPWLVPDDPRPELLDAPEPFSDDPLVVSEPLAGLPAEPVPHATAARAKTLANSNRGRMLTSGFFIGTAP